MHDARLPTAVLVNGPRPAVMATTQVHRHASVDDSRSSSSPKGLRPSREIEYVGGCGFRRTMLSSVTMRGSSNGSHAMAEKNWTHLVIDGRRVSFDRRDNSVTLFPDDDFRLLLAERIGHAEGLGNDWTATAPDGTKHRARGRTAAAKWLIETTAEDRVRAAVEREQQEAKDASAVDEASDRRKNSLTEPAAVGAMTSVMSSTPHGSIRHAAAELPPTSRFPQPHLHRYSRARADT